MRRIYIGLLTATLPLLMVSFLMTGCGKKNNDDDDELPSKPTKGGGGGKAAAPKSNLKPVKATEYGTITGKVAWMGDKPDISKMTADLRKGMVTDRDYCLSGKDYETTEQTFRIGKNNNLGNVFIWIIPEDGYYFDVPAKQLEEFKNSVVTIHQPHCAFLPHASVLFPSYTKDGKQEPTGQKLLVENDAKVAHNSKLKGGPYNPERDQTLAAKSEQGLRSQAGQDGDHGVVWRPHLDEGVPAGVRPPLRGGQQRRGRSEGEAVRERRVAGVRHV